MTAFYNENDAYPAAWLRNLIEAGHIAPGVVDERSVTDLEPSELAQYRQAHFFAGIGAWSHALRLAGWDDARSIWTGSCPCQPFSAAGKRAGVGDERHLWPAWFRLIRECRPAVIFGEQVASPAGLGWLDVVLADLEVAGYACTAFDLCAPGVGAFHIRQRLYFVALADTDGAGCDRLEATRLRRRRPGASGGEPAAGGADGARRDDADGCGEPGPVGDANGLLAEQLARERSRPGEAAGGRPRRQPAGSGQARALADTAGRRREQRDPGLGGIPIADPDGTTRGVEHAAGDGWEQRRTESGGRSVVTRCGDGGGPLADPDGRPDRWSGFWSNADWIACTDGKARPVEPGTFPLAHGAPARVGRLRAYGNAIVAPLAAAFIEAVMDHLEEAPAP